MSDEFKRTLEVNVNTNVDTKKIQDAERIIRGFFDKYDGESLEIGINTKKAKVEAREFTRMLNGTKDLTEEINRVSNQSPSMLPALKEDIGKLEWLKSELSSAFAIFNDGSTAHGLDEIMSKMKDGFSVVAVDLGERVQYLKDQIANSLQELKNADGIETLWNGRLNFASGNMNSNQIKERIQLLEELISNQKELEQFQGEQFTRENAPLGERTDSMSSYIRRLQSYLSALEEYNLKTIEQLKRRGELIANAQSLITWDDSEQNEAKLNIKDNSQYEYAINSIKQYIEQRKNAIEELKANEGELFSVDGISEYVNTANTEIERLQGCMEELQTLRNGQSSTDGAPIIGDLTEVLSALKKIEEAITGVADAFKPLTDALGNEESAINAMVTSNVAQLDELVNKFKEVHEMINQLNNKDFNIQQNVYNQSITKEDPLVRFRETKKEARALYDEVFKLWELGVAFNKETKKDRNTTSYFENTFGNVYKEGASNIGGFGFQLGRLNQVVTKGKSDEIESAIIEMNKFKEVIIQFLEIQNQIQPGSFDASKYTTKTSAAVKDASNAIEKTKSITESASDNIQDDTQKLEEVRTKITTISGQILEELTSIRTQIENTFDFSTINPNLENIKSITDQIYEQFVELQSKIKALDFKIEVPTDGIAQITQVISQEGNEAEGAVPKKNAFTEANKKVAASMQDTGEAGNVAVEGIKAEEIAAEKAYKAIAKFSFSKSSGVDDSDIAEFAQQIANNRNLQVKQARATLGELGGLTGANITFYDPKTLQEIQERYSVRPKEDTEDEYELYRASYTVIENTARAEKKAADEAERRAKAVADSNKWLIEQEDLLIKQENKYKAASGAAKPLAGDTALITENASMIPGIDNTIDGLANSIRTRIRDAMDGIITQDAKNEIIKDLNTLANEIQVQQARKYQSTTLRASDLETSRDVYRQYIDALEADAKKANVFDQMSETIGNLKEEVGSFTADNFVNFLDNVKKAQAKFQAEKSKLGQQTQEQKQQEQVYDKLIQLQNKLYDAKKKLEKQEYGSVNEQEWQRKVNEAQAEYDAALQTIQNADKKAEALRREAQLQSEVKAIINERIKAEEKLAWTQDAQEKNAQKEREININYEERAEQIRKEVAAEKELAAARKAANDFLDKEEKDREKERKTQEDEAWVKHRAEQESAAEKERQMNLEFSKQAAKEAAEAERELAQTRKEVEDHYAAEEKQRKKSAELQIQKNLNNLYRERSTIITAIVKYNNKANTLKTDKAIQRAKDQLEVEKQKLATIDEEINKYGKFVNQSKIEQQNDRLVSRLYDSNKINGITTEQKQDIETVNKLLQRRKEVYDNIAGLNKQMDAASGDKKKAAIQKELNDQQTIYRVLTKQLATYKDIALQRKVTEQDNKFREQNNQNKAQQKIKTAAAADKADLESQKQDYEDILNLVNQLFAAQTALHKINIDPTDNVRAAEREEEIKKVKELSMLLKDVYGIDIKNLTGSLDKNGLLLQEQKNNLLEKERQYKQDIVDLTAKAIDKEATLQKKQQQQEQQRQNRQNQNYGKTEYNKYAKFYESMNATIRNIEQNGSINQYLDDLVQKYTEAYKKIEAIRKQFAENPDAANDIGLKNDFQDAVVEAEKLRQEINGVFNEAKKFDQVNRFGDVFTLDQFNFDDIKSSLIAFANEVTNGKVKLEGFNDAGTQLYGTLDNGSGSIMQVTFALREGTNQLYAYSTATGKAKNEWEDFKSKAVAGAKNLIGMYVGFQEGVQAFRTGVNYVKEIDLAMTELKKVTDETDASYKQFLKDAASASSVIGSTISDFTEATANFARLGYSMEESASMAETAIIYKNVAD